MSHSKEYRMSLLLPRDARSLLAAAAAKEGCQGVC
jgi:hypothetical protein